MFKRQFNCAPNIMHLLVVPNKLTKSFNYYIVNLTTARLSLTFFLDFLILYDKFLKLQSQSSIFGTFQLNCDYRRFFKAWAAWPVAKCEDFFLKVRQTLRSNLISYRFSSNSAVLVEDSVCI